MKNYIIIFDKGFVYKCYREPDCWRVESVSSGLYATGIADNIVAALNRCIWNQYPARK